MAVKGERGVLKVPADWLLRMRHNPFYAVLETRALQWVDQNNRAPRPVFAEGDRSAGLAGDNGK